jgi:hypothetical protein
VNYPDGRFAVQFNGATLGFKVFDKIQTVQPGAIVDNKRLSAVLEQSRRSRPPTRRAAARARCAAAAAEQPRGAGSAVEGAGTTPRCCRGCGLRQGPDRGLIATAALLGRRYAPQWPPASRPPSRRG